MNLYTITNRTNAQVNVGGKNLRYDETAQVHYRHITPALVRMITDNRLLCEPTYGTLPATGEAGEPATRNIINITDNGEVNRNSHPNGSLLLIMAESPVDVIFNKNSYQVGEWVDISGITDGGWVVAGDDVTIDCKDADIIPINGTIRVKCTQSTPDQDTFIMYGDTQVGG